MPTSPPRAAITITISSGGGPEVLPRHGAPGGVGVHRPEHDPPRHDEGRRRRGDRGDDPQQRVGQDADDRADHGAERAQRRPAA